MAEQLFCKQQVVSPILTVGSEMPSPIAPELIFESDNPLRAMPIWNSFP